MRVDGGTKASSGQQSQLRFEQVLSRELSRSSSGKTLTESRIRTTVTASSKRKAPGAERVGVDFKAIQAGKVLRGAQDSARQILSKVKMLAIQGSKTAFAKLGAVKNGAGGLIPGKSAGRAEAGRSPSPAQAVKIMLSKLEAMAGVAMKKAQSIKDGASSGKVAGSAEGTVRTRTGEKASMPFGMNESGGGAASVSAQAAFSKMGAVAATMMKTAQAVRDGAGSMVSGKGGDDSGKAEGRGLQPTGTAGPKSANISTHGAQTTSPSGSGTQSPVAQPGTPTALRTEAQAMVPGTERAGVAAPTLAATADTAPASLTLTAPAEAPGAPEARPILTLQDAPTAQEALLLHGPGLQAVARRAKADGCELSVVYQLGLNVHGAEFVSITTDDDGFITGPEVDIALTEGATDAQGNWVALSGKGILRGAEVTLRPDADGYAFVTDGEQGVPTSVTALLGDAEAIHAEVTAIRKIR